MNDDLFEDLCESVREAGAILRGERETARRTSFGDPGNSPGALRTVERTLAESETTSAARLADQGPGAEGN